MAKEKQAQEIAPLEIVSHDTAQSHMREKVDDYIISVGDLETDPFEDGKAVQPFAAGFFAGKKFVHFWGDDCIPRLIAFLNSLREPHLIYFHNGGKFDFQYMLEYLDDVFIINGRIVKCRLGIHQLRDSYALIPEPLAAYEKTKIDYDLFKRDVREQHRDLITRYLRSDCVNLYEMMIAFRAEFGDALTIGQASMRELKKFVKFETLNSNTDAFLRQYYFGGRNQCFAAGVLKGSWKLYDVNGMYQKVMRDIKHPISRSYEVGLKINKRTNFACIIARNYGALPIRTKDGLDFTCEQGEFWATIHEIEAGLETGTLEIQRIKHTLEFGECISFADFINHFYESRLEAKRKREKLKDMFYKRVMNSCYGKFAQNPSNFHDYMITRDEIPPGDGWQLDDDNGMVYLWKRPAQGPRFYNNVATAASITGAARAILLRGLAAATNPVYCDTDSIICEALESEVSDTVLGAWKLEGEADTVAIAGKKLYAAFACGQTIKRASKGGSLSGSEIMQICRGGVLEKANLAPTFKFGKQTFIKRTFTKTATAKAFGRSRRKTR